MADVINDSAYAQLRAVPDLAGTPVADAGGRPIGTLYGALAEADSGLIRYLDLSLDEHPRHVLVPIGHARLLERAHAPAVRLRAAVLEDLLHVPLYDPGSSIDPPIEQEILSAHGRCFYGERYYAHPAYDHSGLYAGDRSILEGAAPAGGLTPLSALDDMRVTAGDADPRGWPLRGAGDVALGEVVDLLVDPDARAVRYAAVQRAADGAAVLVPVGFLVLDRDARVTTAPGLVPDDLAALPAWDGGSVDRAHEDTLRAALLARLLPQRRDSLPDFRRTATA
jgi:hypothetical protein